MKKHRRIGSRLFSFLFVGGVIFLIVGYIGFSVRDRRKLLEELENNFAFVEWRMAKYERYIDNDTAKSLMRILDKTQEISRCLVAEEEQLRNMHELGEFLEEYVYEQHLSGIFVLDKQLEYQYGTIAEEEYRDWENVLASDVVTNIIQYPKKSYTARIRIQEKEYDFAVVADRRQEGLVVAYEEKPQMVDTVNEITVESMFTGSTFPYDGVVVVTDGTNILTSNETELQNKIVKEMDKRMEGQEENVSREDYVKLSIDGRSWYGTVRELKDYHAYLFFPGTAVFESRNLLLGYGLFVYVLICMFFVVGRYHTARSDMEHIQKQYNTIHSISAIYTFSVLIDVKKNNWEIIRLPEDMREYLDETMSAQQMIEMLLKHEIAPDYYTVFQRFVDVELLKRLFCEETSVTCSVENTKGDWDFFVVAPHSYGQNGKLEAILLLGRDITEEKRREMDYQRQLYKAAEQAKRANVAKTDFLRRMSHDVRTPINGIMGMVEISRHYQGNEEKQEECRRKIQSASSFLLDLVNNVLDMNKLESGEVRLEEKAFDFQQLNEEMLSVIEVQAREKGVVIYTDGIQITHKNLIGSPLHLRQVLQNISTNAIKYNRAGGSVTLAAREIMYEENQVMIEFSCADTGVGMSEEFQRRAFEVFAQEDCNARSAYSGTGLGLPIARELVEQMGGTIDFVSVPGKGTTFTLRIPFRLDTSVQEQDSEEAVLGDISLTGRHVLLVEDNELNMEIARFILENEGMVVTEARNGQEAVDLFCASEQGAFDLILMDIMMPVMGGIEAAKHIRTSVHPDAETVPIFAMTANAFSDDVERSMEAQMNEHISKPIDAEKLIMTIEKYRRKKE